MQAYVDANGVVRATPTTGAEYAVPREIPMRPSRVDAGFRSRQPVGLKKAVGYVDGLLYDCSSPISSATEDTFFQVPIGGQLSGSATVKKTLLHTNLKQAGQLAADERFEVHGYSLWLTPLDIKDVDYATAGTLFNAMLNGYISIKFRGYRDLDYPIISILASQQPSIALLASIYWKVQGSPFANYNGYKRLTKPIILSRSVPVEAKLEWAAAPNAAATNATLLYFGLFGLKEFSVIS